MCRHLCNSPTTLYTGGATRSLRTLTCTVNVGSDDEESFAAVVVVLDEDRDGIKP